MGWHPRFQLLEKELPLCLWHHWVWQAEPNLLIQELFSWSKHWVGVEKLWELFTATSGALEQWLVHRNPWGKCTVQNKHLLPGNTLCTMRLFLAPQNASYKELQRSPDPTSSFYRERNRTSNEASDLLRVLQQVCSRTSGRTQESWLPVQCTTHYAVFFSNYLFFDFRERERASACHSTVDCALIRDRTRSLGVSGRWSAQLSYLPGPPLLSF